MEINPNHPVTNAMHDQWHKVAALLVLKYGGGHVVITASDLNHVNPNMAISVQELPDGLHLRILDEQTARRAAAAEGGLPH